MWSTILWCSQPLYHPLITVSIASCIAVLLHLYWKRSFVVTNYLIFIRYFCWPNEYIYQGKLTYLPTTCHFAPVRGISFYPELRNYLQCNLVAKICKTSMHTYLHQIRRWFTRIITNHWYLDFENIVSMSPTFTFIEDLIINRFAYNSDYFFYCKLNFDFKIPIYTWKQLYSSLEMVSAFIFDKENHINFYRFRWIKLLF